MAYAKNTVSGAVVSVPEHYINHPVLGKNLVALGEQAQAAPKKETKKKEQPAPEVELVVAEPEIINENEELEDGN
jgi:hypothetical protein